MSNMDELIQIVFTMNPNSTPGPDGVWVKFFQACWNIAKKDLLGEIQYFSVMSCDDLIYVTCFFSIDSQN